MNHDDDVSGRLEEGTWDSAELPLPYPTIFDRPVAPSKLDPRLLEVGAKGFVHAHREGWL